jgi:hypothetical protein
MKPVVVKIPVPTIVDTTIAMPAGVPTILLFSLTFIDTINSKKTSSPDHSGKLLALLQR